MFHVKHGGKLTVIFVLSGARMKRKAREQVNVSRGTLAIPWNGKA